MNRGIVGAVLAVCLASCVSSRTKATLVQERAAFDLECENEIEVRPLGNENVYGVEACGRKASYVVECKGYSASSCTAILNSDADD